MKKLSGREGMATEWVEPEVPEKEIFSSSQTTAPGKTTQLRQKKKAT